MFKHKLLLFLYFIFNTVTFAQTLIVDYKLTLGNNIKLDSINENLKGIDKDLSFNFNNIIYYKLIHSKNKSLYKSYKDFNLFNNSNRDSDLDFLKNYKLNDFTSVIYKDFIMKSFKQREYIVDKAFIISDDLAVYKWVIIGDTKFINGLECFNSETVDVFGNKIIAWFTYKIPISNGPDNFHGLPGLIVLLESTEYVFELISFKIINQGSTLEFDEKGKLVSSMEFLKIFKEKMGEFKY